MSALLVVVFVLITVSMVCEVMILRRRKTGPLAATWAVLSLLSWASAFGWLRLNAQWLQWPAVACSVAAAALALIRLRWLLRTPPPGTGD